MDYTAILTSLITTPIAMAIVIWFSKKLIVERLKQSLKREHCLFVDKLQWERKVQEQAARVAEYLALATRLQEDSEQSVYEKANKMSWELAMWLPEETYRAMVKAIVKPSEENNALTVAIEVRKLLLGEKAGNLAADDLASHAPGIGKSASI